MKKNFFYSRAKRLWLWLLLMMLPVGAWAQDDLQALVYIEKTNGSIVKVPITPGYPVLHHLYNLEGDTLIPVLVVETEKGEVHRIRQSEIKRLYSGFEATGIVSKNVDADHLSEKVYSLSGRYVGNDRNSLEGQPKGVYIVKKGGKYQKVVKP